MSEADLHFVDIGAERLVSGPRYVMWIAPGQCVILSAPYSLPDEFCVGAVTYTIETCFWNPPESGNIN